MLVYIAKRLLAMIPTMLGITLITFVIIRMAPGDPVATAMGRDAGPAAEGSGGSSQKGDVSDAIKAKKKLLGMLRESFAVQRWDQQAARSASPISEDAYEQWESLGHLGPLEPLRSWPRRLAASPDGAVVFAGLLDGRVVALDAAEGRLLRVVGRLTSEIWALAVAPDGTRVAAGDANGVLQLLDAAADLPRESDEPAASSDSDGAPSARVAGPALGSVSLAFPIGDVKFLPDGEALLSACDDGRIRLHAVPDCGITTELKGHTADVRALEVAPDGSRFWSGGYDRKLREWDLASGSARVLDAHNQPINDIDISPDGSFLATACDDRLVRVVSLREPVEGASRVSASLRGHYQSVRAVAFSPDGGTLFSGGADKTIRVWRLSDGVQIAQNEDEAGTVTDLLASADGLSLWSAADSWEPVPLWTQYWNWASKIAVFDFDRSFIDDEKVSEKLKDALPVTLYLNAFTIFIIYLVSIPLGVAAAVRRGGWFDNISSTILFLLWSVPNFWLATMLIMWFSSERNWNWFPSVGLHDPDSEKLSYLAWLGDWGMHLVLPLIALTYNAFASLSRYARTSMLETISQDFIRTARAKGLSETVVVYKHALRNSLITIITLLGNLLPALIGGSLIIEVIFSIDGMGRLGFEAILQRDYPVIMAVTTMGAVMTLLGILVSDLLYGVADPRISHG